MTGRKEGSSGQSATARLRQLAARTLEGLGMELVHLTYRREGRQWLLRLMIDREGGVSMDDCATASEQLGAVLEVDEVIPHSYVLEVSSPGLDRPLFTASDYRRFTGSKVIIKTHKPVDGQRQYRGVVEGCEQDEVALRRDDQALVHIPLAAIASGRLEVDLDQELSRSAADRRPAATGRHAEDKVQE
ncbi:MAG: ribosome maturation factor RimP [Xanthomonadales bacterium]|nr:ribosome maturation factor RimP [Xanthomonadales bacterium]NIX11718.1 ribosome maturation factor RimP [Xanthomonadales bacterium]